MALTTTQLQALKVDILATPTLALQPMSADGHFFIADFYNQMALPAFRVWRTNVPTADVKKAVVWTEYIGRSVGERDAFVLMISNGIVNAADPNIRQGFQDIFSGPGGVSTRMNLVAIAKRDANRAEKLFSTGTGTEAAPATMVFEGFLSHADVEAARNLP